MYYVYVHKNKINGKVYVGQTSRAPQDRWDNGKGYKTQMFYRAIQKYGWDNFEHIILNTVETVEEALSLETYWIKQFNSIDQQYGYNLIAEDGSKRIMSPQTREKHRQLFLGEKNPMYHKKFSPDVIERREQTKKDNYEKYAQRIVCLNTLQIFVGLKAIKEKYNISNTNDIGQCCRGKRTGCGRDEYGNLLQWQYYDDWLINPRNRKLFKNSVFCIEHPDIIFDNTQIAARWAGLKSSSGIRDCLSKNPRQTSAGLSPITGQKLHWKYVNNR